jgi:SSS family solute:Na+ symporter
VEALLAASLAVLAAYLALGTWLAVWTRRYLGPEWSARDYYTAGGRLGGFLAAMTYAATTYSSFMIVGLVGFSYFTGVGALGFELSYFTATMGLLAWLARRAWRLSRERRWVTPSGMLADLYGSRLLAAVAATLYLVALIPYAAAQLKGIGEAVAGLAGGARGYYEAGIILALVVMLAWSLVAGIWSVAATDALQGLIMLAAALGLLGWVAARVLSEASWGAATQALSSAGLMGVEPKWPLAKFLAFITPWAFFAVTNPQVVQRLYMPRDERALSSMIRGFGFFGILYTVIVTLTGLLARAGAGLGVLDISPGGPDQVTPALMALAHPALSALVFTSIVAAAVSTADSILLTLTSAADQDLAGGRSRLAGPLAAVLVAAAMAAVAWARVSYIVALSVTSSALLLPLAPPTIAALALQRRLPGWVAWSSLALGLAVDAALIAAYGPKGPLAPAALRAAGYPVPGPLLVLAASLAPLLVPGALRGAALGAGAGEEPGSSG